MHKYTVRVTFRNGTSYETLITADTFIHALNKITANLTDVTDVYVRQED